MNRLWILSLSLLLAGTALAQDDRYKGDASDSESSRDDSDPSAPSGDDHNSASVGDKDSMSQEDKSAATYSRKTLLYFAPDTVWDKPGWQVIQWFDAWRDRFPGGAWTLEGMNQLVGRAIGKATRLVRFDFVDIPYGLPPNQENLRAFSDYMKSAKEDKARAEADFNTRFKEFDVKGRDLERVMNSAFFYQPTLTRASVKRVLVCDKRERGTGDNQTIHVRQSFGRWRSVKARQLERRIQNGNIDRSTEIRVPGETDWMAADRWLQRRKSEREQYKKRMASWKKMGRKGKRPQQKNRCVKWHPEWKCNLAAKVDFHHLKHRPPYKAHFATLKASGSSQKRQLRSACRGAAGQIGRGVSQEMRGLEPFRLLAPIKSKVGDRVGFGLGKREGLRIDMGFYVAEYDERMKRQKIGYSRVRSIADNRPDQDGMRADVLSEAELISGRGDLGNQMLEDNRDNGGNFLVSIGLGGAGTGLTLGVAKSLGFAFNSAALSELWLVLEGGSMNYKGNGVGFGALGLKKRFHAGPLGFGVQGDIAAVGGPEGVTLPEGPMAGFWPGAHLFGEYFLGSGWGGVHARAGVQGGLLTTQVGVICNF